MDQYEASDSYRTEDLNYNVVRVGDELTAAFEKQGLSVLHDREIYDYPSYTGSYNRSGAAIEAYLAQYPDIAIVIDLHLSLIHIWAWKTSSASVCARRRLRRSTGRAST